MHDQLGDPLPIAGIADGAQDAAVFGRQWTV
jgi:hypothetical protein